jgi:hypothetical protein
VPLNLNKFQFGDIRTAISADLFAVGITAANRRKFDGIQVGELPTIFVYQTRTGRLLFTIPMKPRSGDYDFALSPDGHRLAIFDGAAISMYSIPAN